MRIIEIAAGAITIEMQPEEAMDIARACGRVVEILRPHASSEEGLHIPLILLTVFGRFLALLIGCRCPAILAL